MVERASAGARPKFQRVARALVRNTFFSTFSFRLTGSPEEYASISWDKQLVFDAIPSMVEEGASFSVESMEFRRPLSFSMPGDGLYEHVLDEYQFCMEQLAAALPERSRPERYR